ncbi:hypothetical protein G4228_000003 [Cervus hanglu yarkandensis]|nr:hypothetical protein G4228_000003 [Cervus hanglu yarkandensis]
MQAFLFLVRLAGLLSLTSRFLVTSMLQEGLPESVVQALLRPSHISERLVGLQVRGSDFTLGNTPFLILSGTIHYFRVPRDYWKDSLLKLKACGFNTVTTHVPWNLHEPRRGQFHYSGNLDLMAFISLASEVDLWVILCVGPYIGSDLDLGGLPSWLLKDSHMKLRTTYKGFTTAVNHYFDDLIPRIRGFQFHEEGSIIAVQMENEYGSYNLDKGYMPYIKNALLSRGIKTMLLTADTGQGLLKGHTPTVFATLHMKSIKKDTYEHLSSVQGPGPVMMMVYTARSLDGWGTSRNTLDLHMLMHEAREMLQLRFSLNFYMFHGGTNFGFMGGAAFRGHRLPMQPVRSMGPLSMEQLSVNQGNGQSTGYILYETVITGGGVLNSDGHVKDRGQHYKEFLTLRILVENQGRLASGTSMNQERKGLTGNIYLNSSPLRKFKIYSLEMQNKFTQRKLPNIWKPSFLHAEGPAFFLALLRVGSQPKDTFMSLRIIVFEEFKSTLLIYFSNVSQLGKGLPPHKRLRQLAASRGICASCPGPDHAVPAPAPPLPAFPRFSRPRLLCFLLPWPLGPSWPSQGGGRAAQPGWPELPQGGVGPRETMPLLLRVLRLRSDRVPLPLRVLRLRSDYPPLLLRILRAMSYGRPSSSGY